MDGALLGPARRAMLLVAAAVLAFVVVSILRQTGMLQQVEMLHHDWSVAASSIDTPSGDVVLVTLQEEDLVGWGWPIADAKLAEILLAVGHAEPTAIGLDIYRDKPVAPGALDLKRAFAETGAIAISKLDANGSLSILPPAYLIDDGRFGFSDIPVDVDVDGVVRRALLMVNDGQSLQLSIAFQLAMKAIGQGQILAWPPDPTVLMLGKEPLPPISQDFGGYRKLDTTGYQVPLRFQYALPVATSIPARDLLAHPENAAHLKGKVVLIGLMSDSIKDYFRTPLNSGNKSRFTYGLQVQATIVQQLIDVANRRTDFTRSLPAWQQNTLVLAAAALGAALGLFARSAFLALALAPAMALALGASFSYGLIHNLWLPTVPAMLAMFIAFLFSFGTIAVTARRQRKIFATLFSDHLSPVLAAQIWQNRHVLMQGGKPMPQRLQATLVFADLVGSTAIGGAAEPQDFMAWISRVLDEMSVVANQHGGFIEKFTGDGLLIAFGAPLPSFKASAVKADAQAACRCAWSMVQTVNTLNQTATSLHPYRIRIGVHSGEVIGGTLGARGSLQYNLIGDAANVAARIEAFGKRLLVRQKSDSVICLSETTWQLTKDILTAAPVGTLEHDDGVTKLEIYEMTSIL
jgi:adenylate cyclase